MNYRSILAAIFILLLVACNAPTPPTEFAPDGEIIKKALSVQFSQSQALLGQAIGTPVPKFQLGTVNVTLLEPIYIARLSAYHLQGNYHLTLKLPHQKVQQADNPFDIYLQRQIEGKTWRLLKKEGEIWKSYLVE